MANEVKVQIILLDKYFVELIKQILEWNTFNYLPKSESSANILFVLTMAAILHPVFPERNTSRVWPVFWIQ
jgi:hypothetical protein